MQLLPAFLKAETPKCIANGVRLSDFLLWECAYAELVFLKLMWPDFKPSDLEAAVSEFRRRERRFGGISETIPGSR
jgi:hypothetical protein